jgi:ABC-type transport system involved in multi-copper enzyme maturation permease subunit
VSAVVTPYRSSLPAGRDGFLQLLRAEWTKFRTVRGWVIAAVAAAVIIVLLAVFTGAASHSSYCVGTSPQSATCGPGHAPVPLGPGGEAVVDSFFFVHQPLARDGSITVRVRSLTGRYSPTSVFQAGGNPLAGMVSGLQPWSKAGLIVKKNLTQGSSYAAVMVTGGHGVRLQYGFTHDIAGIPGAVSSASPRWLRLTRSGDTFSGYDSTDGRHWTKIGAVRLAGLAATVQVGLFTASPGYVVTDQHLGGGTSRGGPSLATGVFDHVSLQGGRSNGAWRGDQVGGGPGPGNGDPLQARLGFHRARSTFTVAGSGDIAPAVKGASDAGQPVERTLIGAFAGLIVLFVLATLFITSEYKRGLIRTTLAANPRRGQVLAAKALVIAAVTFIAGLAGAAVAVPLGAHILRSNGNYIYPAQTLTEVRVIVGTAALLAVAAVLALAIGTVLRRSAGAVTAVIAAIVLPYLLAVASVLPTGAAQWLLRITPAAAFAIQQSLIQYPQVHAAYTPTNGYFPLPPWAGFAVLCGYTAGALALAAFLLHRRDV